MLLVSLLILLCGGCGPRSASTEAPGETEGAKKMAIKLTSSAFEEGDAIPARHTCDGQDISPPLSWEAVPEGARSLALIVDDPDAPSGTFVHWVIYNLPADSEELAEGVPNEQTLSDGAMQGVNGFGTVGYRGPCPPGGVHRYFFKLYALDAELELSAGATKEDLLDAMEGHVLAEGQLMGTYQS